MADADADLPPADHPSDAARIHAIAEAFEAGWAADDWSRMTQPVRQAPPPLARALAEELIVIDVQRRLARDLTLPVLRSYLDKFPAFAGDAAWQASVRAAYAASQPGHSPPPPPARIGRYDIEAGEFESWEAGMPVRRYHLGDMPRRFVRSGKSHSYRHDSAELRESPFPVMITTDRSSGSSASNTTPNTSAR